MPPLHLLIVSGELVGALLSEGVAVWRLVAPPNDVQWRHDAGRQRQTFNGDGDAASDRIRRPTDRRSDAKASFLSSAASRAATLRQSVLLSVATGNTSACSQRFFGSEVYWESDDGSGD